MGKIDALRVGSLFPHVGWLTARPRYHVHFTPAGYVKGADLFLDVLIPVIDKLQVRPNIAASN